MRDMFESSKLQEGKLAGNRSIVLLTIGFVGLAFAQASGTLEAPSNISSAKTVPASSLNGRGFEVDDVVITEGLTANDTNRTHRGTRRRLMRLKLTDTFLLERPLCRKS
jgi:hypothetical protein